MTYAMNCSNDVSGNTDIGIYKGHIQDGTEVTWHCLSLVNSGCEMTFVPPWIITLKLTRKHSTAHWRQARISTSWKTKLIM